MKNKLTAQDVLTDIEFELALGAISRDELGQGIQQVKQYQNKLRHDVLQAEKEMPQMQEIIGRQFQLNDMLITMLQEVAANAREMELRVERLRDLPIALSKTAVLPHAHVTDDSKSWRDTAPLKAIANHKLHVKLDIQPTNTPIIGQILGRFKHAIHELTLFYVNNLGRKQTKINHTTNDWMLYFEELHHHHNQEINALAVQIDALQSKIESKNE